MEPVVESIMGWGWGSPPPTLWTDETDACKNITSAYPSGVVGNNGTILTKHFAKPMRSNVWLISGATRA